MRTFNTFQELKDYYRDEPSIHDEIRNSLQAQTQADPEFAAHRAFILANRLGAGETAFHWMWNLIVQEMPQQFNFLEIGVFAGQIPSLMSMCAKRQGKLVHTYGVTPLNSADGHPDQDYRACIARVYQQANVPNDLNIIHGYSEDLVSILRAAETAPYDIVFIDGGHGYDTVVSDIKNYAPMVKPGGFLVMDDAANYLNNSTDPTAMWSNTLFDFFHGIEPVARATKEYVDTDSRFVHQFAVVHNRIYKRMQL